VVAVLTLSRASASQLTPEDSNTGNSHWMNLKERRAEDEWSNLHQQQLSLSLRRGQHARNTHLCYPPMLILQAAIVGPPLLVKLRAWEEGVREEGEEAEHHQEESQEGKKQAA